MELYVMPQYIIPSRAYAINNNNNNNKRLFGKNIKHNINILHW